jgi:hypothetical protein
MTDLEFKLTSSYFDRKEGYEAGVLAERTRIVGLFDAARKIRQEWIGDREGPAYDRHTDYHIIEGLRVK